MTTKTIHYNTRAQMEAGKALEVSNGFRALHTDFTNNNQAQGFDVFFDDTPDPIDPNFLRKNILDERLQNDIISFNELKELLRLSGLV